MAFNHRDIYADYLCLSRWNSSAVSRYWLRRFILSTQPLFTFVGQGCRIFFSFLSCSVVHVHMHMHRSCSCCCGVALFLPWFMLMLKADMYLSTNTDVHESTMSNMWTWMPGIAPNPNTCSHDYKNQQYYRDIYKWVHLGRAGYRTAVLLRHRPKCFGSTEYQNMPRLPVPSFGTQRLITWSRTDRATLDWPY